MHRIVLLPHYLPTMFSRRSRSSRRNDRLFQLLGKLEVPTGLIITGRNAGSHTATEIQREAYLKHQDNKYDLALTDTFLTELHECLVQSERTIMSAIDGTDLGEFFQKISRVAGNCAKQKQSNELGITAFFMQHLAMPLNELLRLVFMPYNAHIYWQIVGGGLSGKPDVQLVWQDGGVDQYGRRIDIILAVMEFKTPTALGSDDMDEMLVQIKDQDLYVHESLKYVVLLGSERTPITQRPTTCKVLDQVS